MPTPIMSENITSEILKAYSRAVKISIVHGAEDDDDDDEDDDDDDDDDEDIATCPAGTVTTCPAGTVTEDKQVCAV